MSLMMPKPMPLDDFQLLHPVCEGGPLYPCTNKPAIFKRQVSEEEQPTSSKHSTAKNSSISDVKALQEMPFDVSYPTFEPPEPLSQEKSFELIRQKLGLKKGQTHVPKEHPTIFISLDITQSFDYITEIGLAIFDSRIVGWNGQATKGFPIRPFHFVVSDGARDHKMPLEFAFSPTTTICTGDLPNLFSRIATGHMHIDPLYWAHNTEVVFLGRGIQKSLSLISQNFPDNPWINWSGATIRIAAVIDLDVLTGQLDNKTVKNTSAGYKANAAIRAAMSYVCYAEVPTADDDIFNAWSSVAKVALDGIPGDTQDSETMQQDSAGLRESMASATSSIIIEDESQRSGDEVNQEKWQRSLEHVTAGKQGMDLTVRNICRNEKNDATTIGLDEASCKQMPKHETCSENDVKVHVKYALRSHPTDTRSEYRLKDERVSLKGSSKGSVKGSVKGSIRGSIREVGKKAKTVRQSVSAFFHGQ
ncbi:hypothetical protein B2J93_6378 [Marssonina coronariae]|uniref:Uncharacterized protein n=1 Tax=Diplocarpon coronariae TaxID=2795749 RepID=A0A218Z0C6_9HELO|nr:hypothetical protein B2J93_6378 [Marssonina coronariae]